MPEERRDLHTGYFLRAQKEDGGFGGRMGGSDLYYTSFALRGLSILGELYGEVAEKAAGFLRGQLAGHQTIVDFFSLFYAANLLTVSAGIDIFAESDPAWRDNVASFLGTLRREDGGYAKAPEGHAGSTYHTFLVVLVLELLEKEITEDDENEIRCCLDGNSQDPQLLSESESTAIYVGTNELIWNYELVAVARKYCVKFAAMFGVARYSQS